MKSINVYFVFEIDSVSNVFYVLSHFNDFFNHYFWVPMYHHTVPMFWEIGPN